LHEIKGYGHREIAKLLRCSVGNSKSQLHKAKQRIREFLLLPRREPALRLSNATVTQVGSTGKSISNASPPRSHSTARPEPAQVVEPSLPREADALLVLGSSTQYLAETAV
jgi:hypothetical protein